MDGPPCVPQRLVPRLGGTMADETSQIHRLSFISPISSKIYPAARQIPKKSEDLAESEPGLAEGAPGAGI